MKNETISPRRNFDELFAVLAAAKEDITRMKLALDSSRVTKAALRERIVVLEKQIEEMYIARDKAGAELAEAQKLLETRSFRIYTL